MQRPQPFSRNVSRNAAIASLLACAALAGCVTQRTAGQRHAATASRVDSTLAFATFDSAWRRIQLSYYDTTFHGHDWNRVRAELRPQLSSAQSMDDVRRVIRQLFERLGDSHFAVIPSEVVGRWSIDTLRVESMGEIGIELRFVDGAPLITRIYPRSASADNGVETGWKIERIGATDVDSLVRARQRDATRSERITLPIELTLTLAGRTFGPVGSSVRIVARDAAGHRVDRTLVRRPSTGFDVRMGHLPPQHARVESERLLTSDGCIGILRFSAWMMPVMPRIDSAMDELRHCRAMVVDLRGNVGGVAATVMGVAGHFLDSAQSLGTLTSRGLVMRYVANPRRVDTHGTPVTPFQGPLAILVDGVSVSTSEIFAGGMQQLGRARIFGEQTAGEALPSSLMKLPNGDVLQHVIANFTLPDGTRLEGRGVTPDVALPLRRADLLQHRDATLEAAIKWLDGVPTRTALAHP